MHRSSPLVLGTVLCFCLGLLAGAPARAERSAAFAMPDRYAADVAGNVLRSGGNAADAAVAAAFTLAVTYPEAGNIGGGGFATLWMHGEATFLDFRETAPAAATADMFLDAQGQFDGRAALVGVRASGVPGTVDGLQRLHARYGSLPWDELLGPAIALARDGFEVHPDLAALRAETEEFFGGETNFLAHFGDLRSGARFRQRELADTLERIAGDPGDFYTGETARLLLAQVARGGGLISARDLGTYRSQWREPLREQWRDLELLLPPPPSSGGIALLQLLRMFDLRQDLFSDTAHNDARYVHLLAELEKRVFADRAEYLGDPDFVNIPVTELTAPAYLRARSDEVQVDRISPAAAVPPGLEHPDTTHFSILDGDGNAVSLTYTLNWDFGNGVVVEGAGFLLNNEMDDFSAGAGIPNVFGVVGSEANAIAPGKRMLSSMTPVIALRGNEVAAALGTQGGSTIITTIMQTLLNVRAHGMSAADAVAALRFHHQLPEGTLIRHDWRAIPDATRRGLESLGYRVERNSWGDLGDVQLVLSGTGGAEAASDPRGRGVARVITLAGRPKGEERTESE